MKNQQRFKGKIIYAPTKLWILLSTLGGIFRLKSSRITSFFCCFSSEVNEGVQFKILMKILK